jgi:uncharacterized protein YkvS
LLEVKPGEFIETFDGYKGEIVAVYTNTAVVDFSIMKDYTNHFEEPKQVVKLNNIKRANIK